MYALDSFFIYKALFAVELMLAESFVAYRLPRRRRFALRAVLSAVAVIGLALAVPLVTASPLWTMVVFFSIFAFSVAALKVCFAAPLNKILFCAIAGYTAQHIAYTLFDLFVSAIGPERMSTSAVTGSNPLAALPLISSGSGRNAIAASPFTVMFYAFFYGVTYFFFYKYAASRIKRSDGMQLRSRSVFFLVVLIIVTDVIISAVASAHASESFDRTYAVLLDVSNIICCALALYLQFSVALMQRLERDLDMVGRLYEQEARQYALIKENIERIDIKCHDLKHQLRKIGTRSAVDENALKEMENIISVYDSRVKTGNEALDIILTEKSLLCSSEHITLSCIADGKLLSFMTAGDIYAMFGNLVDNAIEAVMKLDESSRSIGLKVCEERGMVYINIYNRYSGELVFENGMPKTGKEDKNSHGFGLKSVAMIAAKYGGEPIINVDGGVFSVSIALCRPQTAE